MKYLCSLCGIAKEGSDALESHMLNRHRNAKRLRYACEFPGCGATYDICEKAFLVELLSIEAFDDRFGAYQISKSGQTANVKFRDLEFTSPQLNNRYRGKIYITLFGVPEI